MVVRVHPCQPFIMKDKDLKAFLIDIDPKWHADFMSFVETGEASLGFQGFLNANVACQEAMDRAISLDSAGFEELAEFLKFKERTTARVQEIGQVMIDIKEAFEDDDFVEL